MICDPEKIVSKLFLHEGMYVADFGAGSGFFSKACSPYVGQTGKVFAIEIQKDLVKKLEEDIRKWGLLNVDCVWGDIERVNGTKIASGSIDYVIVANVLFQLEDMLGLCDEVKRILKKNGRILIVEKESHISGENLSEKYTVGEEKAKETFNKRGFKFIEKINVGDYHYGLIFES